MIVYIKPSLAQGTVLAPPSKSEAHRALICAALSGGSTVYNVALSEDIKATLSGLSALGASVEINGDSVHLGGLSTESIRSAEINVNESGSTLRFLIPIALLSDKEINFFGSKRLFERDLSVYEEIAENQGFMLKKGENSVTVRGPLKSGAFKVRGDISSQFVSGLMFALPILSGNSFIEFSTGLESKPYVDLTVKMLSEFGVTVGTENGGYSVTGNQIFKSRNITVSGDYSNAAFLEAFNLLGGRVEVTGLNPDTVQGDSVYKEFYKTVKSGGSYDLSDCPDLAPIMFALAAEFSGARFTGTARLKIKESDRAAVMKEELKKFGGELIIGDNEVIVNKTKLKSPIGRLCSHNDHRVLMALSVLASKYGGEIEGAEAVNKSYPGFFDDIKKLGIEVDFNDD